MGNIICPCSRNNVKLKSNDMDDKDETREPILQISGSNKESTTLKVGQNTDKNNIAWKYGSLDKNQQNDITTNNKNNKEQLKSPKSNNKDISSSNQSLTKNNKKNEKQKNKNEDSDESEISDLSDNENIDNNENIKHSETLPTTLPISTETIVVSNAGFDPINGEYRWFLHSKKWCLFREDNSYCIENNVDVQNVYTQLISLRTKTSNFRWKESIDTCWVIANFEGNIIYYASPQYDNNTIPNSQWVSIHGSKPLPILSNNPNHSTSSLSSIRNNMNNISNGNSRSRKNSDSKKNVPVTIHEENDGVVEEDEESPLSDIQ